MTFLAHGVWCLGLIVFLASTSSLLATPANKAALERDFDRFLGTGLARGPTRHLPSEHKEPKRRHEVPPDPLGQRLPAVGRELENPVAKDASPARRAARARAG